MMEEKKQSLRREMRAVLREYSAAERSRLSARLVQQLRGEAKWTTRTRIFGFVPLPSEPDYTPALGPQQSLYVPRCEGSELVFARVEGGGPDGWPWQGQVGLWEPPLEWPQEAPSTEDLLLVPGLAFTSDGARLGRGGGFYDRFLARFPTVPRWGLCFPAQLLGALPTEDHDIRVHRVLT
jgi:5-formyltetrahydrofolate cyclo-ligase